MVERTVFIHLPGEAEAVPAGRLSMIEQGLQVQASTFAYGRRYVTRANALPVDPVALELVPGRNHEERVPAGGLAMFGALRDATPDAWGRRVIENRLRAPPNGLPESVYLDHAGPHRAGALDVRETPTSLPTGGALPSVLDLRHLLDAAARIEEGELVPAHLEVFFAGGPSVGGARPKAVVTVDGGEWIAKFPARNDAFNVPLVERATLELAREAGLAVPRTRMESLADGRQVMLIERFDREPLDRGIGRLHMVSALTLLALHEQDSPDSSYAAISDAMGLHGVSGQIASDRNELFGRMVFNILVSNDDDHLRNYAFLFDAEGGGWRLSPLYDVVPKPQVAQERMLHLSIGPQGRLARLDNALAGAGRFGLLPPDAARVIERVVRAVRSWRETFEGLGVSVRECDRVASAFRRAVDIGMRDVDRKL
ncbi:MAG: HipA domain-containing protein [Thermomonas sp.]|uniref:type II toxin-antitoxin system HipA family toxin n=1 Tax=Thermomonas sp. TaxID=1971895 RepID=UPI0039E317E4